MAVFTYSATDRAGKTSNGEREAKDEKELAQILKSEGLLVLEAKEKGAESQIGSGKLKTKFDPDEFLSRLKRIGLVDKMFFARNLSVMLGAGLALTRALEAIIQETSNPKFKKIIIDVLDSVVKGKPFAESLRLHQNVFGDLFINMVEVGETSGKLTLVLGLLSSQMKKDHALRKRVRGAMMYPAVILTALLGIGMLMMIYVVPTLTQTIKELNVPLPATTVAIMAISDFILKYYFLVLIGMLAAVFLFWKLLKIQKGKAIFDRLILKVPIFGPLAKKLNTARFCRTLFYLITSGIPIVRSLEITSSVLDNTLYKQAIREASSEIQKGTQLNKILALHPHIFQPLVTQMINIGEETGKISNMLLRLALFFEEEVNSITKNLSTIIEPILMIIIGAIVGIFVISMLQPIYSSLGNI